MPASSDNNPGLINSRNPLSYMGVNPYHPPELFIKKFPPTTHDGMNMQRGALWLNVGTSGIPTGQDIWMLVSQAQNVNTWVQFGAVGIQTLTASTNGVIVPGDNNANINIVAGTGITVIGDIPTNSLTINSTNAGAVITVTGTTGGPVHPDGAGNLNLYGSQDYVTVTGHPSTHILDVGVALTVTGSDAVAVPPSSTGNFNLIGAGATDEPDWITVTGNAGTNTLTINAPLKISTDFDLLHTSPDATGDIKFSSVLGMQIVSVDGLHTVGFTNTGILKIVPTSGDTVTASELGLGSVNFTAGAGMTITGNNTTSTVTFQAQGLVATLTGNTGGAISPDGAANINIVGGTNISVAGNAGTHTLTINTSGAASFFWISTAATTVAMLHNVGYITTYAGLTTLTLPGSMDVGDVVEVTGFTGNSWKVAQNASQYIRFGNIVTTTGTGGSLASSDTGEGVRLVCTVANTAFQVLYAVGNLTYV